MWHNRRDEYVPTGETYGPVDSPIFIKHGKKYIKINDGRATRYLVLPNEEPIVNCTQLMQEEWNKLVEKSKYPTREERELIIEENMKKKAKLLEESIKRKQEIHQAMESAEKARKLDPLEREAEFFRRYTINRAKEMGLDDEDSMKEFNRMLALKKCIATWDEQVLEKAKIKEDEKKEKRRQEKEAEKKRRQNLKDDEKQRQKANADRQNFIQALGEQIKEREDAEKLKMEVKNLERRRFNKATKQSELDELEASQQKVKENEKLREEQRRVNVLLQRLQAIDKEEDRLFSEKAKSNTEEIEREIEEKKMKQLEIELKRKEELQKMADDKAKAEERAKFKDLMSEILRMDDTERSWRQKELMEAKEKRRQLDAMYAELEQQVEGRRLAKAQVIDEERREVCKIAKDNIEDEAKDNAAERKIKIANEKQRMEILLQINDIERRKLTDREDRIMESNFYKIQEERRVESAKNCMWRKADRLRKDGLPEKYVLEVENYINEKYGPRTDKSNE